MFFPGIKTTEFIILQNQIDGFLSYLEFLVKNFRLFISPTNKFKTFPIIKKTEV